MYSLVITMIGDRIECETVDISVVISSKPSEFSHADCGYVIASNFSSSSESVKFFIVLHHDTLSVSSFSEYLELFSDFNHISVALIDVILLVVSDVCPRRKLIYLCVISLEVTPSESDALYLLTTHGEISRQIAISNDDYKFVAYPHSILQKFAVKNMVIFTIHSKIFPLGTVNQLLA